MRVPENFRGELFEDHEFDLEPLQPHWVDSKSVLDILYVYGKTG